MDADRIHLRALEKSDLALVHRWNNNFSVMRYWFEEPYESFVELEELYNKHIHDQSERRFIIENSDNNIVGLVELLEIDYIHRNAEYTVLIDPNYQGRSYALQATEQVLGYAFNVLNLHKVYLLVDERNEKAIHVYKKAGFIPESVLIDEIFVEGAYRSVLRMYALSSSNCDSFSDQDSLKQEKIKAAEAES
ncbi:Spermidine N(1)-acetyltransferase [Piscirickettsia salmonis]|uniref:spermidine N1-acetyltransferase n=1 Tax=Piscirickettsia salmonis TaxID=1238 RepID=UPI000F08789C|nr:spermidine N1-acetyltransferase [Piscirickettsia salmonis]RNC77023.1 spermidine N1-acetyltransferase [Piscirickettsiaceae bacterium NZ-RLO2]QGP51466.1 Spermidine N(1)-acetyltransferase [Piscirickettsia salmonis]QGP53356.1 Spermidine N(1)-acetyltransferase [Piscirickettsia salmonis]QGP60727.1 Spermidine N(1)-acetyltransferase [Piscirickettsia salmonis]QGP62921.1 Spermidine N(1)-acetyltransferase [Piscirickettsia salmonis]